MVCYMYMERQQEQFVGAAEVRQHTTKAGSSPDTAEAGDGAIVRHATLLASILILGALLFRMGLLFNGWPLFESDQSIIGLMARHIWLHGEHPLFFYGQDYMGPVEAYSAVPFFALFGSSIFTLRLAIIPLVLLFLVTIYMLGRIMYGPVAALLALAWLALGPSIAVDRELTTAGGKQEMLVLAGVILLCVWDRLKLPERRPQNQQAWLRCVATYAVLGAAYGLGVWSDWLITPLVATTFLVLLIARPREVLSWPVLVLALSCVVGAFPFLKFNVTHGFASVRQGLHFSGTSGDPVFTHFSSLVSEAHNFLSIDLPAIFGSPNVCVQSPADLQAFRWIAQPGSPQDLCSQINGAFSLLIIALYALAAWPLIRAGEASFSRLRKQLEPQPLRIIFSLTAAARFWQKLDTPLSAEDTQRAARLWLRGILLACTCVWMAAFINNPADLTNPLSKSRYLVPLYLGAPLLFGALWDAIRPGLALLSRFGARKPTVESAQSPFTWGPRALASTRNAKLLAIAAGASLLLLLSFSIVNGFAVSSDSTDSAVYALPEPASSAQVLAFFDAHHVRTFYTDSYYTCYRFAFESDERQVCAVLGPDGHLAPEIWINRYAPYISAVTNDPHHAYLLSASPSEITAFEHSDLPTLGYRRALVGRFAIYYFEET